MLKNRTTSLRTLLTGDAPAMLLEAHDAVSAKLVEEAGFDGVWASSLTLACTLGVSDGDAEMGNRLAVLEAMTGRVSVPILFDADTGCHTPAQFASLVRRLEGRAVAGVCIEDKEFPKRNSFIEPGAQTLVSIGDFCAKVRAGLEGRSHPGFVLVARTEALIVGKGLQEALQRARAYSEAGADAILVHSRSSDFGEIAAFMAEWSLPTPVVCIPTTYSATDFSAFERARIGAVIWANQMLRSAVAAMADSAGKLRRTRCAGTIETEIAPLSRLLTLQGGETAPPVASSPGASPTPPAPRRAEATHSADALVRAGVTDVFGVPCAILEPLQQAVEASRLRYLAASVEGEAVALAVGSWLAGRVGAVLLQNSGLGNAINPIVSLVLPHRIPLLLLISWRGQPGTGDAPHHQPMGTLTLPLLDQLGVRTWTLNDTSAAGAVVEGAARWAMHARRIAAVLVPRDTFAPAPRRPGSLPRSAPTRHRGPSARFTGGPTLSRLDVMNRFREFYPDAVVVSTTGLTSRTLYDSGPADEHFYMQGSMGFALAIGLAVARASPNRVFVLDGDGALIMRMGTMATVGQARPPNLVHVVFDNQAYSSTGGQPSSGCVEFSDVALACGYRRAARCEGSALLDDALHWLAEEDGPCLLHVLITATESASKPARPEGSPHELADRFRARLGEFQTRSARTADHSVTGA